MHMKLVSLNLNHRTHAREVRAGLLEKLSSLEPDVICFNEFVSGPKNQDLPHRLTDLGFAHQGSSRKYRYSAGRFHNQILIASRTPIESVVHYETGMDDAANSNVLTVITREIAITGFRAPAYKLSREWDAYWDWAGKSLSGDVLIGDFNIDPVRARKRDRAAETITNQNAWQMCNPKGDWSYKSTTGVTACLDHCAFKHKSVEVTKAQYIASQFVPEFSDHAALMVELRRRVHQPASIIAASKT